MTVNDNAEVTCRADDADSWYRYLNVVDSESMMHLEKSDNTCALMTFRRSHLALIHVSRSHSVKHLSATLWKSFIDDETSDSRRRTGVRQDHTPSNDSAELVLAHLTIKPVYYYNYYNYNSSTTTTNNYYYYKHCVTLQASFVVYDTSMANTSWYSRCKKR